MIFLLAVVYLYACFLFAGVVVLDKILRGGNKDDISDK